MIVNMNPTTPGLAAGSRAASAFEPRDPAITHKEPHYHGFCWSCCHPSHSCCCHVRTCRKEAKELLVVPQIKEKSELLNPEKRPMEPQAILDLMNDAAEEEKIVKLTNANKGATRKTVAELTELGQMKDDVLNSRLLNTIGRGSAIIGGCCCVHLSIEYMPSLVTAGTAALTPVVVVSVTDSEATTLTWQKSVHAGSIYQIKENIIVTKPGAYLDVVVRNVVARVRWCEIFSC